MNANTRIAAALAVVGAFSVAAGLPDAHALRGRGAAFVVGAAAGEASSAAAEQQAAAAQQQAAAAQQQAAIEKEKAILAQQQAAIEKEKAIAAQQQAAQAQQAAAGKPLPVGTVVAQLPPGCTPTPVGGKNYQYCDGTFYEPVYEGSTLKYVTTIPK